MKACELQKITAEAGLEAGWPDDSRVSNGLEKVLSQAHEICLNAAYDGLDTIMIPLEFLFQDDKGCLNCTALASKILSKAVNSLQEEGFKATIPSIIMPSACLKIDWSV